MWGGLIAWCKDSRLARDHQRSGTAASVSGALAGPTGRPPPIELPLLVSQLSAHERLRAGALCDTLVRHDGLRM